jgi:hypothetical protein
MTLNQNASLGSYTENDFYLVLGKEQVIDGDVAQVQVATAQHGERS